MDFGDHVDVGRDGGGAGGLHVGHGRAVGDDLHLVEAVAVDGKGAGVLGEAGDWRLVVAGVEVAGVGRAGDEFEQLDGAAAFDVELLDLLRSEGVALLAGGGGGDLLFRGDGDGGRVGGDGKLEAGEVELVADVQRDVLARDRVEAGRGDAGLVGAGGEVQEAEEALGVGRLGDGGLVGDVEQLHLRIGDGRAGGVLHGAGDGAGAYLRGGEGAGKQDGARSGVDDASAEEWKFIHRDCLSR